jgi:hypothetical protein
MYWMILFSLLYVLKKNLLNNQRLGLDERIVFYPDKILSDNESFEKIMHIHETNEKIHFLDSENISIEDKLYEIANRNIPEVFVMINGGLFNDWNFEFQNL